MTESHGQRDGARVEEEASKEFGANVHIILMLRRHEEPELLPHGGSADALTPKGKERAALRGKTEMGASMVKGFGSAAVERARHTAALILENVPESVRVVNQRITEEQKAHGVQETPSSSFSIRARKELNPIPNLRNVFDALRERAKEMHAAGDARDELEIVHQLYLDCSPEELRSHNVPTHEETAAEFAYAVVHAMEMSGRLRSDSTVQLEQLSHGPKFECFLKEVAVREGQSGEKNRGFTQISEIGGMTQPGETIRIDIQRKNKNETPALTMQHHGMNFTIDMERLNVLAAMYEKKKHAEKKK